MHDFLCCQCACVSLKAVRRRTSLLEIFHMFLSFPSSNAAATLQPSQWRAKFGNISIKMLAEEGKVCLGKNVPKKCPVDVFSHVSAKIAKEIPFSLKKIR